MTFAIVWSADGTVHESFLHQYDCHAEMAQAWPTNEDLPNYRQSHCSRSHSPTAPLQQFLQQSSVSHVTRTTNDSRAR